MFLLFFLAYPCILFLPCNAAKFVKTHLNERFPELKALEEDQPFRYLIQDVPLQKDSTSCGWRVIANAWRFIEAKFRMTTLELNEYPKAWLMWVREKAISQIMATAVTPNDPDSPLPNTSSTPSSKSAWKRKGPPVHSPLKFQFQKKKRKEKDTSAKKKIL